MGDISAHFSRAEFACRCGCGFDTVDTELVEQLEQLRTFFDAPVIVSSGCRCHDFNDSVEGHTASLHLWGRAADHVVQGIPADAVQEWWFTRYPDSGGIGQYNTFTHRDTRTTGPATWDMRKQVNSNA